MAVDDVLVPAPDRDQLWQHVNELVRAQVVAGQAHREERRRSSEQLEAFALELLEVADMLASQGAHLAAQPGEGPWLRLAKNIGRTRNRLMVALERQGVEVLSIAPGDAPDYRLCTAISRRTIPGGADTCIVEVLKEGYQLGDRVLRPAEVVIGVGEAT